MPVPPVWVMWVQPPRQYWNPAKYPFAISRAGVSLNYTPWLRELVSDMDLAYLAGYYRIGDYSAISGSLRYFSLGEVFMTSDISATDNAMTINPYEMSVDVAYSMMLSEKFSWAAALRFIYSDLTYDYTDGYWYTLDGLRLSRKPQRPGLYIHNGKARYYR